MDTSDSEEEVAAQNDESSKVNEDEEQVESPRKDEKDVKKSPVKLPAKKKVNNEKQFFFDRTSKEHSGMPLYKEFKIKGYAIYLDSGPDIQLLSKCTASLANKEI